MIDISGNPQINRVLMSAGMLIVAIIGIAFLVDAESSTASAYCYPNYFAGADVHYDTINGVNIVSEAQLRDFAIYPGEIHCTYGEVSGNSDSIIYQISWEGWLFDYGLVGPLRDHGGSSCIGCTGGYWASASQWWTPDFPPEFGVVGHHYYDYVSTLWIYSFYQRTF